MWMGEYWLPLANHPMSNNFQNQKRKIMKGLKVYLLVFFLAAFSMACQRSEFTIVLTNDTSYDRVDEPVIISRADLEKQTGKISDGFVPMLVAENGMVIPSQADDINGDGIWDELFLLASLAAHSQARLSLSLVNPGQLPVFIRRSNVRLASPQEDGIYTEVKAAERPAISRENHGQTRRFFQFEGPGWENDRVGFRNYFDERNGMDIFGKTTEVMVLENVGINEDYHALQDWGMDILKVGASLGAGAIALELDGDLHRVAPGSDGSYKLVTNGPLRSIFQLRFDNWNIKGNQFRVLHEITIYGSAWYYKSNVSVESDVQEVNIVTGITTLDLDEKQANFTDYENGIVSLSTHGQQAIEGEYLGMAVMLETDDYLDYEYLDANAPDINHTFAIRMKPGQSSVSYKFYSSWEVSDERFASSAGFAALLENDALRMGSPLEVQIK
jgi:hypothetical protein